MKKNLPKHIAIIPDGNRRWASERNLPISFGHWRGSQVARMFIDKIFFYRIPHISFWTMSLDNFSKRSKRECENLINVFSAKFKELLQEEKIHQNQVKINIIGKWRELFPEKVVKVFDNAIDKTKDYHKFNLNFFIAYDGIDEMKDAVGKIIDAAKKRDLKVTSGLIKDMLFTKNLPSVDLLIRTGGDPHLSGGFMMWDTANAQLYFHKKFWPNLTPKDVDEIIIDYQNRQRRFGS